MAETRNNGHVFDKLLKKKKKKKTIIVSKMTSHCACTVQMAEVLNAG